MKRQLTYLVMILMVVALAACSKSDDGQGEAAAEHASKAVEHVKEAGSEVAAATSETAAAAGQIRHGRFTYAPADGGHHPPLLRLPR